MVNALNNAILDANDGKIPDNPKGTFLILLILLIFFLILFFYL
jgi:hypothetical protein